MATKEDIRELLREQRDDRMKSLDEELDEMKATMRQDIEQEIQTFIEKEFPQERRDPQSPLRKKPCGATDPRDDIDEEPSTPPLRYTSPFERSMARSSRTAASTRTAWTCQTVSGGDGRRPLCVAEQGCARSMGSGSLDEDGTCVSRRVGHRRRPRPASR